jgi:ribosomal protein S5
VAGVLIPVVVDSVEVGVVLDLRGTATGLVQVVALEGDLVTGTVKVDIPVVATITGGRVVRFTVDVVVGDRDTVVSFGTQDVVLTTNASSLEDESVYVSYEEALGKYLTVTWSIQTKSAWSRVMASPPQTY